MSLSSLVLAKLYGLPPRLYGTTRQRNIALPMDDGVTLMTDVYSPRVEGPHPTILMRLPYGRHGFDTVAECYAERGFHVVLQACRGTEKSGGDFDPLVNERADGLATLRWIKAQDWYDGRLGLSGPSYLGYAQWAICDELPATSAMATKVTSAEFQSVVFPSGAFHLGLWLSWLQVVEGLRGNPLKMSGTMFSGGVEKRTARAAMTLPLLHADKAAVGHDVPFWQSWFESAIGNDDFWKAIDHRHRLGPQTPPNHFISGWHDFMLDQLLRDYQTLVSFGHQPYLTVGPWTHIANDLQAESMRETLTWMRAKLLGDGSGLREKPVRIFVTGLGEWRDYDSYPPGPPAMQTWYIQPARGLGQTPSGTTQPDRYRYDPANPTPNVGGNMFAFTGAGPVDNAPRENRGDVLSYTSEPLAENLTIIGQTSVTLHARASVPHADFFLRLCDVGPDGISLNICDGLIRVTPETPVEPDGSWWLDFTLHAAAHSFRAGHRLRLQVSSGAHPRYARNLGTDEPVGTATRMVANDVEIIGAELGLATYEV
ncbi:CocE/NonD family hydrolase [Devosia oryziradicis]|uniref:CocE/NonD family hydrolase n=1 Tax=Devosia oryziradicis TaxID=2801335 RepID=A0ABX7BZM8_9HYPH|nr:CocE/NonD family hydrolase [Devosia oryziradicis]QQR37425.1 CocE/NonD family hydrolase [Devosia oryziradicis]